MFKKSNNSNATKNKQKDQKVKTLKDYKNDLYSCNHNIAKLMGNKMSNPIELLNSVIDHYQWLFETGDVLNLHLNDYRNQMWRDLFIFAISSSDEFANDFLNYYLYSIQSCYDKFNKKWDLEALKLLMVRNKRKVSYDLVVMYMLIASCFDNVMYYVEKLELNPKINISFRAVVQLFFATITQEFFDDLKQLIIDDRKNKIRLKENYILR